MSHEKLGTNLLLSKKNKTNKVLNKIQWKRLKVNGMCERLVITKVQDRTD